MSDHDESLHASAAPARGTSTAPTPLAPILAVTFLASLGTGVLWNGVGFVAKSAYGYDQVTSFLLFIAFGVAYVLLAFGSGSLTRALAHRARPRSILAFVFLFQALAAPLVLLPAGSWTLWLAGSIVSGLSAIQWPIIESYLAAGRPRTVMRAAIGWWNVVWMTAVAIALTAIGPLLGDGRALWAIVALVPLNALCLVLLLLGFRPTPGADDHDSREPVPATYRHQLHTARVLLPTSYVLVGAVSPLLPYVLAALRSPPEWATSLAATWLFARVLAVVVMWRTRGWHGHWGTLLVGGVLMASGFTVAVLAPHILWLVAGLVAYGIGQGIIYYAAIYYAMAVGQAEVDAAGTHEGLIGLGYVFGPAAGALAFGATADDHAGSVVFLAIILGTLGLMLPAALRPWLRERRLRRTAISPGS